jgi:hypothetical protein
MQKKGPRDRYGKEERAKGENVADWVKSNMHRLGKTGSIKIQPKLIRMNCQGWLRKWMEKMALLNELKSAASNMVEFGNADGRKQPVCIARGHIIICNFRFAPARAGRSR